MNDIKIYIEDQLMETDDKTVIATSYKMGDIGDLRTRFCNHSNRIKFPKCPVNDKIFELSLSVHSDTDVPYRKLSAKVLKNGLEIMPNATAVLVSVGDAYNVELYSGSFTFFDRIKDKNISEIDFGEGLITWDAATIDASRNLSSSALLAPFVQYGNIDTTGVTFVMTGAGKVVLPSVRFKDIIENIITNAGYTSDGSVFSNDVFLKMVVPFSKSSFYFSGNFNNNREFIAEKVATQTSTNPAAGFDAITFPVVIQQDGYGFYNSSTGRYDASGGSDDRDFHIGMFVELEFTVVSGTYNFKLASSDVDMPNIVTQNYTAGTYKVKFGIDIGNDGLPGFDLSFSSWIEARVQRIVAGQINITSGKFYNKVYGFTFLTSDPKFLIEEILPDTSQSDIMRYFAIRFGLMFFERGTTLECKTFGEVISNKVNVRNWTLKRDTTNDENLSYVLNNYAQRNKFNYDSNDDFYRDIAIAHDGFLLVGNENTIEENDFYTSVFFGTITQYITNTNPDSIYAGYIPIFDSLPTDYVTEFNNEPGLRIMLIRDKYSTEPSVTYDGSARSDYGVLYFVDPNAEFSMEWEKILEESYSELSRTLQKPKLLGRDYLLTDEDIAGLDLFNLIFDNGVFYIINQIKNYVGETQSTKTEIFKVS